MGFDGLLPIAKKMATASLASSKTTQVWEKLVPKDDWNPLEGQALVDQANTICDLNAYLVMVIAAGVTRVEAMKKAVSAGQAYEKDAVTGGKDRAWCFKKNAAKEFEQAMIAWSKLPGNGVVQLKFRPEKGVHTFAVERVTLTDDPPSKDKAAKDVARFRVYQAYEAVYRLADFLGIAGDQDRFLKERLDMYFEGLKSIRFLTNPKTKKEAQEKRALDIDGGVSDFSGVRRDFGAGDALTWEELNANVVSPIKRMLSGSIDSVSYTTLTGVPQHPKFRTLSTDKLLVLMCDRVSPADFEKNYSALPTEGMKLYVDFPEG